MTRKKYLEKLKQQIIERLPRAIKGEAPYIVLRNIIKELDIVNELIERENV